MGYTITFLSGVIIGFIGYYLISQRREIEHDEEVKYYRVQVKSAKNEIKEIDKRIEDIKNEEVDYTIDDLRDELSAISGH